MKNLLSVVLLAGVLVGGVGLTKAGAQLDEPLTFETAFPFIVGNATFPAGRYRIEEERADPDDDVVLELTGSNVSALIYMERDPLKRGAPMVNEIVFRRYGDDRYVLSEVWEASSQRGVRGIKSRTERNLEEAYGEPETVAVPASR